MNERSFNKRSPGGHSPAGTALRALRVGRGLTLADVSRRTGLPVSTLSKVENGKRSLSYQHLAQISAGLEVEVGRLFAVEPPEAGPSGFAIVGRRSISRSNGFGDRTSDRAPSAPLAHSYPAAELLKKRLTPVISEVHARTLAEFGEMLRHRGEAYLFVVEGAVELHTRLYAPLRLGAGDSIYFDAGMAHAVLKLGDGPCRILTVSPASG
jgi:transcriptional regulator with XRE-family HTH domain